MSVVGESLNGGVLSVKVNDAVMMSLRAGLLVLALGFAPADGQTMCSLLDPLLTALTESTPLTCTCENTGSAATTGGDAECDIFQDECLNLSV